MGRRVDKKLLSSGSSIKFDMRLVKILQAKKRPCKTRSLFFNMVGVARFELATSRPPDARATKLRYTPILQIAISPSELAGVK